MANMRSNPEATQYFYMLTVRGAIKTLRLGVLARKHYFEQSPVTFCILHKKRSPHNPAFHRPEPHADAALLRPAAHPDRVAVLQKSPG